MGLPRAMALLLALALIVTACDDEPEPALPQATEEEDETPAPPRGLRAGVVVPPGDPAEDHDLDELLTDLRSVAATLPAGVDDLRILVPDAPAFVPDYAELLLRRGSDLVCVLGPDGRRVVTELAGLRPQPHYCAAPVSRVAALDGVALVDIRFEEVGHAVGVAARAHAGDAPVGVVVGPDRVGADRFLKGLAAAVGEDRLVERSPNGAEAAEEAVREVLDEGVAVVVVHVGAGAAAATALAAEHAAVIAPSTVPMDGPTAEQSLVTWRVRWDAVLRPVVEWLVDGDRAPPESVGLAEDVLRLLPGAGAGAHARTALTTAEAELRDGVRDPLEPSERDEEPEEEPEEEPGEEPDDAADHDDEVEEPDDGAGGD